MNELLTKGIGHTEFKDSPVGKIPVTMVDEQRKISNILISFDKTIKENKKTFTGYTIEKIIDE
jgi:hypothetical protein